MGKSIMAVGRIHICPVNDLREHNTNSEYCICAPSVIEFNGSVMVIHNAFDGREFFERDHRELQEECNRLALGNSDPPVIPVIGTTT